MPSTASASSPSHRPWLARIADYLHNYPDDHPVQIALRTYALGVFLSLSPPVMTFIISRRTRKEGVQWLLRAFKRELNVTGFAFAMTVAVGGGAALRRAWLMLQNSMDHKQVALLGSVQRLKSQAQRRIALLKDSQKTFMSYTLSSSVAIALLQYPTTHSSKWARRPSATLDLTLLLLVRAIDSVVRHKLLPSIRSSTRILTSEEKADIQERRKRYSINVDAFVFWACSAR
jgi:hypothetical protein